MPKFAPPPSGGIPWDTALMEMRGQPFYRLFRKTLSYIVRDEETVLRILGNLENKVIEK